MLLSFSVWIRKFLECFTATLHEAQKLNFSKIKIIGIGSVQFSRSAMSDSLRPHGLQHARLPCLPPSPGVCSNSCPLSQWCHPTFLSSVTPLSACLQSFPASGSFPMSWLFVTGGQSIGASASVSVLPMNIHWEFLRVPSDMFLSFARTSFPSGTRDVPASACIFPLSILNEGILWF